MKRRLVAGMLLGTLMATIFGAGAAQAADGVPVYFLIEGNGSVQLAQDGVPIDTCTPQGPLSELQDLSMEPAAAFDCVLYFHPAASEISLTAQADPGWTFHGWSLPIQCVGAEESCIWTPDGNSVPVTAIFSEQWVMPPPPDSDPAPDADPCERDGGASAKVCESVDDTHVVEVGGEGDDEDGTRSDRVTISFEGVDGDGDVDVRTVEDESVDDALGQIVEISNNGFQFDKATVCLPQPDPEELRRLQLRLEDVLVTHEHEGERSELQPHQAADGRMCVTVSRFSRFWLSHPTRTVRATDGGAAGAAAAWSNRSHPEGTETVYVASSASNVDGLLGAATLGAQGVPLLLVEPGGLPAGTARALSRLAPRHIVVIGGLDAVSQAVADEIAALTGASVSRMAGADRAATAAAVSREIHWERPANVYLVNGDTAADLPAVAAAAAHDGSVVLLTHRDSLPAETAARLAELAPEHVTVVGGVGAISDAVAARTREIAGVDVTRIGGSDRYATARALARKVYRDEQPVTFVADGSAPGDLVVAGAAAAINGSPLVVTPEPDQVQPGDGTQHVIQFGRVR